MYGEDFFSQFQKIKPPRKVRIKDIERIVPDDEKEARNKCWKEYQDTEQFVFRKPEFKENLENALDYLRIREKIFSHRKCELNMKEKVGYFYKTTYGTKNLTGIATTDEVLAHSGKTFRFVNTSVNIIVNNIGSHYKTSFYACYRDKNDPSTLELWLMHYQS